MCLFKCQRNEENYFSLFTLQRVEMFIRAATQCDTEVSLGVHCYVPLGIAYQTADPVCLNCEASKQRANKHKQYKCMRLLNRDAYYICQQH